MHYTKFSLLLIVMILLLTSCGSPPYSRGEESSQTIMKPENISDIHKSYAYFSTAAQGLQSMVNGKELKAINQSIKNNIINGWKTIPAKYLPTNFSKQRFINQSIEIDNNNCSQLLGSVLAGLAMVKEYNKANELIRQFCEHSQKIIKAYNYASQITDESFIANLKKKITPCP